MGPDRLLLGMGVLLVFASAFCSGWDLFGHLRERHDFRVWHCQQRFGILIPFLFAPVFARRSCETLSASLSHSDHDAAHEFDGYLRGKGARESKFLVTASGRPPTMIGDCGVVDSSIPSPPGLGSAGKCWG